MDIEFKCSHCEQDLSADAADAGSEIECPACHQTIVIPQTVAVDGAGAAAGSGSTPELPKEERHFSVPVLDKPGDSLIAKPLPSLEASAKEGLKLRIK